MKTNCLSRGNAVAAMAMVALCADALPAVAQQVALEEIVVTARKREEFLQDIPLSITAFTADELSKRNIQEMRDIALFTPGFNFEDFGGAGGTSPVIRGATQVAGSIEQNVSFFFDGVYLPRNYVTDLGFSNMARIEVVKGPQSARYGRNAFMGAVNYIPMKPTDEFEAQGEITIGNHGRFDGSAVASGPIIPGKLSALVAVDYSKLGGTWRNTHPFADIDFKTGTDTRLGGWEKTVLNGAVRFTPTDDLTIDVSYYNYDQDQEHRAQNWFAELNADSQILNCGQYNPDVRPAGSGGFGAGGDWFRLYCGEIEARSIPIDPRGYSRQLDADFFRASVNYDITEALQFEYIYGNLQAETKSLSYKDTLPGCTFLFSGLCVFENSPIGDFITESHEGRVSYDNGGAVTFAAGLFYTKTRDFVTNNFTALPLLTAVPTEPVDILDEDAFPIYATLGRTLRKSEIISPFAEVNVSLLEDRARVSVEARWSEEDKFQGSLATGGGSGLGSFTGLILEDTFTSFTPRFTAEYDLADDNLLFVSAAKGVKAGGFNATAFLAENRTFDEDSNWTYELGSKNTFADGRVRLNATLFWIDWTDVQIPAQDPGNPAVLPISITRNLGDVRSKGIEIDGAFVPTDNLSLNGSLYYGDSNYRDGTLDLRWGRIPSVCDDVVCATNGDIGGNQTERQSKWQVTAGSEWRDSLSSNMDLDYYLRADVTHQSKQFADAVNISWVPSRTIVNTNIGIAGEWYEIQVWARNLFDEKYVSRATVGQPNVQYNAYLGERRTFGVTLKAKY